MNVSNVIRDGREELRILCYKASAPPMTQCSVIWKYTLTDYKCISQSVGQPLGKKSESEVGDFPFLGICGSQKLHKASG